MDCIVQTPVSTLADSIAFYDRLGFRRLDHPDRVLYTDGKVVIQLNPDRFARAGIRLFADNWEQELGQLRALTHLTPCEGGYVFTDPSGVHIYLTVSGPDINAPVEEQSYSSLGNYAGLSLEAGDYARSAAIYKALGFEQTSGSIEQGWASFSRNGFGISLMPLLACPHLFFNPSLTYFNGKANLSIIEGIRKAGIPITEEITYFNKEGIVDNVIIRDPGGYGFFIFSD